MEVIIAGQSSIEVLAKGQPNIEAVVQGHPTLEIDATKESRVEAQIVGDTAIECVFTTKVIDSYKAVDEELSTTSENPVQNKTITAAINELSDRIMTQELVVMSQEEYDELPTKEEKLYFLYEE